MRATRAYLAGFGTSGSLLAGAAAMFLLASAIVAFRGWPQVGDQPAPVAVSLAHTSLGAAPSRTQRLLIAAAARATVTASRPGAARGVPGRSGSQGTSGAGRGSATPQSSSGSGSTPGGTIGTGGQTGSGGGSAGPVATPPPVQNATGTVSQVVSSTGQSVGSTVSQAAGSVASGLSGSSPTAANAVGSAGSTAGSAVTTTANTAANAVNSLGGGQ